MTQESPVASPPQPSSTRAKAFRLFGTALALALLASLVWWFVFRSHYESTDDAYVSGDVVQVTSEVPGTVTAVNVQDTDSVRAGDVLVELDPADAQVAVAAAEAELAHAVRGLAALFAQEDQLRAELAARQVVFDRVTSDLERRTPLAADGAVSNEEFTHARGSVEEQRATLAAARARLAALSAQTRGTTVAAHPDVERAAATLRNAALALRRTRLTAPVAGVIARRSVQLGERVAPGAPLMALVALREVWVDANFKEVQLRRVRVGQSVTVVADLYGSSVEYHGRVAGLAAGSGAAFALLPAQNASGNWIKIVQRVPVRIRLEAQDVEAHPLRIGLSTVVRIDVADQSGPVLASADRPPARAPAAGLGNDPAVDARIQAIIAANSGPTAARERARGP